jgi:predicted amidohydrolase
MQEQSLPNYETVPLRQEEIVVTVVQSRVTTVDPDDAPAGRRANLEHMLHLIDTVQAWSPSDLLAFHEFPLGGLDMNWTRQQVLNVAIEIPGAETEAIGARAKQYNCYIHFGCYGKLDDWPGHFMNLGIIIGPTGEILLKRWKLRNLSGFGFSTTIYDVLDEYVARYGWDAVFPICRTDIGNIAIMPEVLEPELGRIYAMKGAEIVIRYMTAGAGSWKFKPLRFNGTVENPIFIRDLQMACAAGEYYGIFVNNSLSLDTTGTVFDLGSGGSAIFDCNGQQMAEAISNQETSVSADITLAAYRKTHSVPVFPVAPYRQFYNEYLPKYPPNTYSNAALPDGMQDGLRHYRENANW